MVTFDEEGYVLINRNARAFRYILRYYVTGDINQAIIEEIQDGGKEESKDDSNQHHTRFPFLDPITWAALESDLDFYFPGQVTPQIQVFGASVAKTSKKLLGNNKKQTNNAVRFSYDEAPIIYGSMRYYDSVCASILECVVLSLENVVGSFPLRNIAQDTTIELSGLLMSIGDDCPSFWQRYEGPVGPPDDWVPSSHLIMSFLPGYGHIKINGVDFPRENKRRVPGQSLHVTFTLRDVFYVFSPHFGMDGMLAELIKTHISEMISKRVEVSWTTPTLVKEKLPTLAALYQGCRDEFTEFDEQDNDPHFWSYTDKSGPRNMINPSSKVRWPSWPLEKHAVTSNSSKSKLLKNIKCNHFGKARHNHV